MGMEIQWHWTRSRHIHKQYRTSLSYSPHSPSSTDRIKDSSKHSVMPGILSQQNMPN